MGERLFLRAGDDIVQVNLRREWQRDGLILYPGRPKRNRAGCGQPYYSRRLRMWRRVKAGTIQGKFLSTMYLYCTLISSSSFAVFDNIFNDELVLRPEIVPLIDYDTKR